MGKGPNPSRAVGRGVIHNRELDAASRPTASSHSIPTHGWELVGREGFVVRTTITAVILSTQSRETAVVEASPSAPVEEVLASLLGWSACPLTARRASTARPSIR
jgi:hypothetical protein